jgi:hypothetical protein
VAAKPCCSDDLVGLPILAARVVVVCEQAVGWEGGAMLAWRVAVGAAMGFTAAASVSYFVPSIFEPSWFGAYDSEEGWSRGGVPGRDEASCRFFPRPTRTKSFLMTSASELARTSLVSRGSSASAMRRPPERES